MEGRHSYWRNLPMRGTKVPMASNQTFYNAKEDY